MGVVKMSVAAAALAAGGVVLSPVAAVAATGPACDAYSHHCPHVIPNKIHKIPTVVKGEKTTLPFTGAEIVLMTVVGGGALATGTVFLVGGRRRRAATT